MVLHAVYREVAEEQLRFGRQQRLRPVEAQRDGRLHEFLCEVPNVEPVAARRREELFEVFALYLLERFFRERGCVPARFEVVFRAKFECRFKHAYISPTIFPPVLSAAARRTSAIVIAPTSRSGGRLMRAADIS